MRLVELNCRMALHPKLWLLEHLRADIAIVPECAQDLRNQVDGIARRPPALGVLASQDTARPVSQACNTMGFVTKVVVG